MNEMNEKFSGSIVAMVTPMGEDDRIDATAWEELLEWQVGAGSNGLVVAGTTGESATLDASERDLLLERALGTVHGRCAVIAGTGSSSTAVAIEQSRRAAQLGADAVLVVAPYYNRPPQRGLEVHYQAVADASTVPVILYNVPLRTAVDLEPATVMRLAEHANIVAIKEAVADMGRVRQYAECGLVVLSGDDPSAVEAIGHGASGVISVAANVAPVRFAQLCSSALKSDHDAVDRLDRELRPLYRFLASDSNPIPVKWMLAAMGRIGARIRPPLVPLAQAGHSAGHELIEILKLSVPERQ